MFEVKRLPQRSGGVQLSREFLYVELQPNVACSM
jgi:hypothetical protein